MIMFSRIRNSEYFMLFKDDNIMFSIIIHNLCKLWYKNISKFHFMNLLVELNKQLEVNREQLLIKVKEMLTDATTITKADIKLKETGELYVNLVKILGYPLRVSFDLQLGSPEMYFEEVTLPLINTVRDLKASESDLIDLVKKKDREIEEYKLEGGKLFLKYLKTPPFNLEEHSQLRCCFAQVFGTTDSLEDVMQVARKKRLKQEVVKSEITGDTPGDAIDRPALTSDALGVPGTSVKQAVVKSEILGDVPVDPIDRPAPNSDALDVPGTNVKQEVVKSEIDVIVDHSVPTDKLAIKKGIKKRRFLNL